MGAHESRRGARIAATFWVGIEGIDEELQLRQGNLSASGLYIETDREIGPAGSMQFLHIASEDHRVAVQVLARVIRVMSFDDLVRGRVVGLALQFMPSSHEGRQGLERLVRHVVQLGLERENEIEHRFDVDVTGQMSDRTTMQHLNVQKLVLETDWQAHVGDLLQFEIRSPGAHSRVPLEGQVTNVALADGGYRVEVHVTRLLESPDISQAVDQALLDLIVDTEAEFSLPAREHMSGQLARIALPSLLSLFEMEHMSGTLDLTGPLSQEARIAIARGRIASATASHPEAHTRTGREAVARVLRWKHGEFCFVVDEVALPEDGGLPITGLLLDIARQEDEESVDRPAAAPAAASTSTDDDFI